MRKRFIQKGHNGTPLNGNTSAIGFTSDITSAGKSYIFNGTFNNNVGKTITDMTSTLPSTTQLASVSKQVSRKTKGLSEGTMNTIGDVSNIVGTIADAFPTLDKTKNTNDAYVEQARDFVSDALLKSGNPFAMAAGAAVKVIDKTGGFTDASKGLGGGLDAANVFAAFALPGVGYFAPKTDSMELDQRVQSSSAYSGLSTNLQEVSQNADAKILFGYDKANSMIADAKSKQNRTLGILDNADMARYSASSNIHSIGANLQLRGGYNSMVAAKNGAKLFNNLEDVKRILESKNKIETFKQGGSINVIPDGALHARKHHLEEIDEKYKEVTHKGIPVISESEGGEITQHAEVEKEEIIFRLEVTQKLEKLAKENTDESAIEAGKLLVEEILYNTKDNTNKLL